MCFSADLQAYAVELTQKLIQFPTENPPGRNYYQCAQFLKKECENLGLKTEMLQVRNTDRYIILAQTAKGKTEIHFHCHYDVVPAGSGWSLDPFGGNLVRGRIYGRGSSDMKGAVASILTALKAAENSCVPVSLSLTPDEETGGKLGAEYIIQKNLVHTRMAILPEPTGLRTIFNACKGALWFEIVVRGEAGHSSLKGHGLNAFEKMVEVASRLCKLKESVEKRKSSTRSYPPGGEYATLVLGGRCSSGEAVNAVPGKAVFTIDRRTLPEENVEEARREIAECIGDAHYEILLEANPFCVDETAEICQLLQGVSQKVVGSSIEFALCPGFLDARHFVQAGIPCISWGPGIYEKAHTSDEYVRVEDIMTAAEVFYTIVSK